MASDRENRQTRGFTLLEMVVVLTLIVAATVLAAPSFRNGLRTLELEGATRDLITRMKMARSEAVSKQQVFRLLFKEAGEQEQVEYLLTDDYESPLRSFHMPAGITVTSGLDQPREEALKVSFYPNGRSSGGLVVLTNGTGRTLEVEVDPVTGLGRVKKPEDEP